jgi:hypothetical protein
MGIKPLQEQKVEAVTDFTKRLDEICNETHAALELAAQDMARFYDPKHQPTPSFKKGDKVWLEATYIRQQRPAKKLSNKRLGPFTILEQVSSHNYKL